jgi:acetyltransferase-like isoleucine patch superfamily enzyme
MRLASRYRKHRIGPHTYGEPKILFADSGAKLAIGSFCSIASQVTILLGGEHRTDWITAYPFAQRFEEAKSFAHHSTTRGDVVIGSDVWIGRGATIRSGVQIGHGAIIGAGSVVTRNVEPYAVVAGNPARLVRKRFSEPEIARLLATAWWDWPLDTIKRALPLLLSPDIERFLSSAPALAAG